MPFTQEEAASLLSDELNTAENRTALIAASGQYASELRSGLLSLL